MLIGDWSPTWPHIEPGMYRQSVWFMYVQRSGKRRKFIVHAPGLSQDAKSNQVTAKGLM